MIFEHAERDPGALALDDLRQRRNRGDLMQRLGRIVHLLREGHGLEPGAAVAVLMGNRVEYVELVLGAILAGLWVTPINRYLAPDEIRYVVADSGARLLFCDPEHAEAARAGGAPQVIVAGDELEAALADRPVALPALDGPAGGPMIYTSGTTGRPKGVKRATAPDLATALANQARQGRAYGLDGSGPHLVTGPLHHAAPLLFAIYDLANGAPVVIQPRFDAGETLRLLEQRGIAHTHLVPTMFVRLLRLPDAQRAAFDASRLGLVLHGAAPITVPVKRRMIDWWGPVLVEYWGGTEGGVNTLVGSEDWLAHPGTVGRALPAFEVYAADADGRRLPPGEAGRLHCRHRQLERVFVYHGDPEKTRAAQPAPGVFLLGDVGMVDADGWVHLVDRSSNLIISGGVNIYPAEVEAVLSEHPSIADVAVFGIPDDEWGETVKAAIELEPEATSGPSAESAILDWARERLARYKVPRSVDFVERLPRHPDGKLHVRRLRDPYWAGRERKI